MNYSYLRRCERQPWQLTTMLREAVRDNTPETFTQAGGRELSRRHYLLKQQIQGIKRDLGEPV